MDEDVTTNKAKKNLLAHLLLQDGDGCSGSLENWDVSTNRCTNMRANFLSHAHYALRLSVATTLRLAWCAATSSEKVRASASTL